ncbi:hypothetical protein Cgig2_010274 [Carnegiea gigantea]|uniref:Uncharacterized protein n=1 Tax=Carnegiea gigantea TaxID=171969 RepID=A0A9Q1JRC0_9CARY|nr:hypothetical protein Cgig2_010274 [Carnegiea gigantea]
MFDKEERGLRGIVPFSVRGRCTLEKICKFNKTLEPYHKEAIEGMILKPTLEYRPFFHAEGVDSCTGEGVGAMKKSLQTCWEVRALLYVWLTGKRVEFGEDDLCRTELANMVRLRMAQYVTEKSDNVKSGKGRKKPVFRKCKGDEEAEGCEQKAG